MNEGSRCINDQLPGFDIARDETGDDDRPERAQGSEDDPERQVADDVRGNVEGDRRGTPGQTFWPASFMSFNTFGSIGFCWTSIGSARRLILMVGSASTPSSVF